MRAQPPKTRMQAMRRVEHLRTQPPKKQVQAMQRGKHLRLTLRDRNGTLDRGLDTKHGVFVILRTIELSAPALGLF